MDFGTFTMVPTWVHVHPRIHFDLEILDEVQQSYPANQHFANSPNIIVHLSWAWKSAGKL
jgi:hypothetical protein